MSSSGVDGIDHGGSEELGAAVGLDIGSSTVKLAVLERGRLVHSRVLPTTHDPMAVASRLLHGLGDHRLVATGYGRRLLAEHRRAETITEIRAVALGARRVVPGARTVLDLGGQDIKVVSLRADGSVLKFEMNDRCAAGTGRFLEVMATALAYSMDELVAAGTTAARAQPINSMCAVFAESEVVSATARGVERAALARGLHEAVARRALSMLRRMAVTDEVVFCGGGARNRLLHRLISESLQRPVVVPPRPQILAALGAAISASTSTTSFSSTSSTSTSSPGPAAASQESTAT